MKVIMTGGGTGGHIYPAIAIADKIKQEQPDAEILFVGTDHGLEKKIVPQHGYPIKFVTAEGIDRKNLLRNVNVARKLVKGKMEAKKIVEDFKPDMVIGTGGYASAPVIKAGYKFGADVYIHESNAFPGLTNKVSEKYTKKVFLGFADAGKYFKQPEKHVLTGNPVRKEFFTLNKADARKDLGMADDRFVVLAFGGSQGAGRINKAMMDVIEHFNGADGIDVVLGTGSFYYDAIIHELETRGTKPADNIRIKEYINDMDKYLTAADMVISRSGALTVAEVTVCGKPAVFIPSPIVTGNHQFYNAKAVADKDGAFILEEKMLSGEKIAEYINMLRNDRSMLERMSKASRDCALADATDVIYANIKG